MRVKKSKSLAVILRKKSRSDSIRSWPRARVGCADLEMRFPRANRLLQSQGTGRQRDHDVVVGVHVVSGISAGREAPLRDGHAVVLDLNYRRCFLINHLIPGYF